MTKLIQCSTFLIGSRPFGIDVTHVQEITRPMPIAEVPLAPNYIYGLINLRGQIATAVGLRELFSLPKGIEKSSMNVVCLIGDMLLSLVVDQIGDVMEINPDQIEPAPQTIPENISRYMKGVFKLPTSILSILEIDKITESLNENVVLAQKQK